MIDFSTVALLSAVLVILLIFLAPELVLRLLTLVYPRNSVGRRELIAELRAMRRLERPTWVGEQIETALREGLRQRLRFRVRAGIETRLERHLWAHGEFGSPSRALRNSMSRFQPSGRVHRSEVKMVNHRGYVCGVQHLKFTTTSGITFTIEKSPSWWFLPSVRLSAWMTAFTKEEVVFPGGHRLVPRRRPPVVAIGNPLTAD